MDILAAHLSERYGVAVEGLVPLDEEVYRVDGPGWVARRFPPGAAEAVDATAALLRRLEPTRLPAERLAHAEPVSLCGDRPVLVTEFVEGRRAPGTPRMFAALGGILGALHARSGDTLPPGGGWHHLVLQGTLRDEIAAALALLERADDDPPARQALREELRGLDDCADLPHGIVHPDFVPINAIRPPEGGVVIVDWTGAGRGPRLPSLAFLLWAAGLRDPEVVESVVDRYRQHVQLDAAELERLPGAIAARPLTLDCWSAAHGRMEWTAALERRHRSTSHAKLIAERARRAFTAPTWASPPAATPDER